LQALIAEQQMDVQRSMIGREVTVLVEKPGRMPGQMAGKSEYLHAVHLTGAGCAPGDLVRAVVERSERNSLAARILVA
jgi:tRNA-2-methylthio-N6-dimethylallyladenosine synthase